MTTTIDALLIPADDQWPVYTIQVDRDSPKGLAAVIGADWIEIVRTRIREVALVVDEDGLATTKAPNRRVNAAHLYPGMIVGDVLLCGFGPDDRGRLDLASITAEHIHRALMPSLLARDGQVTA